MGRRMIFAQDLAASQRSEPSLHACLAHANFSSALIPAPVRSGGKHRYGRPDRTARSEEPSSLRHAARASTALQGTMTLRPEFRFLDVSIAAKLLLRSASQGAD